VITLPKKSWKKGKVICDNGPEKVLKKGRP
jgi:hypothetical protein